MGLLTPKEGRWIDQSIQCSNRGIRTMRVTSLVSDDADECRILELAPDRLLIASERFDPAIRSLSDGISIDLDASDPDGVKRSIIGDGRQKISLTSVTGNLFDWPDGVNDDYAVFKFDEGLWFMTPSSDDLVMKEWIMNDEELHFYYTR